MGLADYVLYKLMGPTLKTHNFARMLINLVWFKRSRTGLFNGIKIVPKWDPVKKICFRFKDYRSENQVRHRALTYIRVEPIRKVLFPLTKPIRPNEQDGRKGPPLEDTQQEHSMEMPQPMYHKQLTHPNKSHILPSKCRFIVCC